MFEFNYKNIWEIRQELPCLIISCHKLWQSDRVTHWPTAGIARNAIRYAWKHFMLNYNSPSFSLICLAGTESSKAKMQRAARADEDRNLLIIVTGRCLLETEAHPIPDLPVCGDFSRHQQKLRHAGSSWPEVNHGKSLENTQSIRKCFEVFEVTSCSLEVSSVLVTWASWPTKQLSSLLIAPLLDLVGIFPMPQYGVRIRDSQWLNCAIVVVVLRWRTPS